jgi:hypothetical protein
LLLVSGGGGKWHPASSIQAFVPRPAMVLTSTVSQRPRRETGSALIRD